MADQVYDWVASEALPEGVLPAGYTSVYRRGSPDYGVGYAYTIENGPYAGRNLQSEKWPASYDYKACGIKEIAAQSAARSGCMSIFEGRFHVPVAWLKKIVDEEDARQAEVTKALASLGYALQEPVKYQSLPSRLKLLWLEGKFKITKREDFAEGYLGTTICQGIVEVSYLDDGTVLGWYRDYGLKPLMLLTK